MSDSAFPFNEKHDNGSHHFSHPGMTLRDWFAGQALQGCLAYSHLNESWGDYHNNGTHQSLAEHCYAIADAMLAARHQGQTP